MLNINQGHNAVLLKACRPLREYQEFVTLVRDGQTVHHLSLSAAINAALEEGRADGFAQGRAEALAEIERLKAQIAQLTAK